MKITFVLPRVYFYPGGGAKVVMEYANYLKGKGHDVAIYYHLPSLEYSFKFVSIKHNIHMFIDYILGNTVGCKRWFPLEAGIIQATNSDYAGIRDGDIIVATAVGTAMPIFKLPKQKGRKIYFIQGYENWSASEKVVHDTYALKMKKIVVANWLKRIVDLYSDENAEVISNGIDTSVFYDTNVRRKRHSIAFHYRTASIKGCEYALSAIECLKNKYPDLCVSVVTVEKNLPKFPSYFDVFYRISPKQVAQINNYSEVFLCSSIEEGFGLPGLEAMACGCALVSTSFDGALEYAKNGENALLSPIRDVDSMVNNVVRLFENPRLLERIRLAGVRTGFEKAFECSAKRLETLFLDN